MDPAPPRFATLVLVDGQGRLLGALPARPISTPWWMEIAPVVEAVRTAYGLRVTVLRLLAAEGLAARGGAVTYLAQCDGGASCPALQPWAGTLPEHPLRLAYARPGGPQADSDWAGAVLQARGLALVGEPQQIRSWNLSSLWSMPTAQGPAWLKVVPPFFAHEGAVIAALAAVSPACVPTVLGHDGARLLLAHIDGSDRSGATGTERLRMVDLLVGLQRHGLGRADELHALGLPDWRGPALTQALRALLARRAAELPADDQQLLATFADQLPSRFDALATCGLPDGLVHGDFHPGNLRGDGQRLTLLDWADSGIGHPLLDQPAFLQRLNAADALAVQAHWVQAWQQALPQADPARAARLLAPVAAARQALIYQRFLDQIEDAEHPYHRADVRLWLQRTAQQLRQQAAA